MFVVNQKSKKIMARTKFNYEFHCLKTATRRVQITDLVRAIRRFMGKLFGTDGIRGRARDYPLDDGTVRRIGAAFAQVFSRKLGRAPRFITGRDTRESGKHIEKLFHEGAAAVRAVGESAGVITTPGVAFLTGEFGFDVGVVISASHNPYEDNGVKMFQPSGQKLSNVEEEAIEEIVRSGTVTDDPGPTLVDLSGRPEFLESYIDHLAGRFTGLDLSGKRIVVDCANGAAYHIAPEVFKRFGSVPIVINASPDGRNINKDCGSLHLENLQPKVASENADFGVAFDVDADRALFVNEKGEIVDGDATLFILSKHMKAAGDLRSGKVVATVMSNIGLETALREEGIELLRTPVGDKYVLEELLTSGSEIGGEQSGHIIIPKNGLVGDGLMTALSVLNVLAASEKQFSELSKGFQKYPQVLINVAVKEKKPFEEVPEVAHAAAELEKKLGDSGRLLLRYSGTENLARVMIEGTDQTQIEKDARWLADVIERTLNK
jgi:phosphoglucosamine mutase